MEEIPDEFDERVRGMAEEIGLGDPDEAYAEDGGAVYHGAVYRWSDDDGEFVQAAFAEEAIEKGIFDHHIERTLERARELRDNEVRL